MGDKFFVSPESINTNLVETNNLVVKSIDQDKKTEISLKKDYIEINNTNGNNIVLIGTNGNNNGKIIIKKDDGSNFLTVDNSRLILDGTIEANNMILNGNIISGSSEGNNVKAFIVNDKYGFTTNRKFQYEIPNKNYIDKRVRTDYEDKYWRQVSTRLKSLYPGEEYPVKIKEFIIKNKIPMRYSFDVIENKKGIHPLTKKEFSYSKFNTYPGSMLKIGTNKNWSFSFTKAKRKTVNRAGKEEYLYDNNNNIVYEKPLITENIII